MSTQNVSVARFARNVEWDFFCGFQTPWMYILCCITILDLIFRMCKSNCDKTGKHQIKCYNCNSFSNKEKGKSFWFSNFSSFSGTTWVFITLSKQVFLGLTRQILKWLLLWFGQDLCLPCVNLLRRLYNLHLMEDMPQPHPDTWIVSKRRKREKKAHSHCLKMTQNVAFELFKFRHFPPIFVLF